MRRQCLLRHLAAALVLALAAFSQTLPSGVQKVTAVEGITEYALPNGLHVLLFPDLSKPKVMVNMTYLVGSRHEGYGETGMAHLMEHMLYLHTTTGRNIKKELTNHGAVWNGTTDYDRTNYFEITTASDENLRWAINLEADRMVNMRIEKALLDTEMTVVLNELEMGENNPDDNLRRLTMAAAYTFHNYGKPVIGSRSDVENAPIERLAAFYKKYYQPDNAVLTIAGQFNESNALAFVASSFGAILRPQRLLEKNWTVEPTQEGQRSVTLRRMGDFQQIMVIYHTPAAAHPDTAALKVLAGILGDNPSGRLYKALVYSKEAVSVGMYNSEKHDPGFATASVRLRPHQSLDQARETLVKTIEGVVNEPVSKEEVERAKDRILKQIDLALTDPEGGIGFTLSEYIASGDWRLLFLSRDRIKNVTEQDVMRVAKAYLKSSNRTLGEFVPTKSPDRAEIPATPDVVALLKDFKGGEPISAGEAFSPTPTNVENRVVRGKLPSGLRMALLPRETRGGMVVALVRLDFGDEKSLFGKAAVGQLTGQMLMRGTRNKTRQQIQDEMDRLKANIGIGWSVGAATATIEATATTLSGALHLAAEILREPSFPQEEFEQLKQQQIASLEARKGDPARLGFLELQRRMNPYPRGDVRYVGTLDEQSEDLQKVTLDKVRGFYKQFYGASDAKFVVSGRFDPAQLQELALDLFGDWKSPGPFTRVPNVYAKTEPGGQKIETPDKQMAVWLAGVTVRMTDEDPDYPAMVIADYVFGGSGGARLFKRIRDKEGLSYRIFSSFQAQPKDDGATFMVRAMCAPQNVPKVEASFRDELARTLKDGFTPDEVATAKKSWLDEQAVARTEEMGLLTQLTVCERFDRTMKWNEALEAKVAELTPQHVTEAFRRHVDPAALYIVKAGDFKKAGVLQ